MTILNVTATPREILIVCDTETNAPNGSAIVGETSKVLPIAHRGMVLACVGNLGFGWNCFLAALDAAQTRTYAELIADLPARFRAIGQEVAELLAANGQPASQAQAQIVIAGYAPDLGRMSAQWLDGRAGFNPVEITTTLVHPAFPDLGTGHADLYAPSIPDLLRLAVRQRELTRVNLGPGTAAGERLICYRLTRTELHAWDHHAAEAMRQEGLATLVAGGVIRARGVA